MEKTLTCQPCTSWREDYHRWSLHPVKETATKSPTKKGTKYESTDPVSVPNAISHTLQKPTLMRERVMDITIKTLDVFMKTEKINK